MIIDSLTHVTPDGRWFRTNHDAGEARLLREMDAAGVERAVVVPLAGFIPNEFVLDVCGRHPGRLAPGASFNPAAFSSPRETAGEFRAALRGTGFKVLKLHPRLNRYDPLDPRVTAVLEELAGWNECSLVWLDSLLYFSGGTLSKPPVDTLHELIGRHPELRFVLLHAGGAGALHLAEAIRDCPNTWLDVSFTMRRYAGSSVTTDLAYLLRTFDRRMIFGSDFPEIGIGEALADFRDLSRGLESEKLANVLGGNLAGLLDKE
ncbi:MAG: amidohydrolase family protein [Planctomycetota bacterium]|nr:amidohydrolase family protein [Planctomycetota bacterium]